MLCIFTIHVHWKNAFNNNLKNFFAQKRAPLYLHNHADYKNVGRSKVEMGPWGEKHFLCFMTSILFYT